MVNIISNITCTREEMEYRRLITTDLDIIRNYGIECTVCSKNLGTTSPYVSTFHPLLEVLICTVCYHNMMNLRTQDKHCTWCGEYRFAPLIQCIKCKVLFCEKCIRKNSGLQGVCQTKFQPKWECYICDPRKIWSLRAISDVYKQFLAPKTSDKKKDDAVNTGPIRADKTNDSEERSDEVVA